MGKVAVKRSDLGTLIWFLNLDQETLQAWDGNDKEQWLSEKPADWDKMMSYRRLLYLTGSRDDNETVIKVQSDIKSDLLMLLDPGKPVKDAVDSVLSSIEKAKLEGFRRVLSAEDHVKREKEGKPFSMVTIVRVSPPAKSQKGRGKNRPKPITEALPIAEQRYNESARQTFYGIVDDAMRTDTIQEIRSCLNCQTFFLFEDRLTYCSDNCQTEFNNKRRSEEGYFKRRRKPKVKKKAPKQRGNPGRELFLKVQAVIEKNRRTIEDRELLERVQNGFTAPVKSLKGSWEKQSAQTKKDFARTAARIALLRS